jgi:signal recognition particle receptor subunit beta
MSNPNPANVSWWMTLVAGSYKEAQKIWWTGPFLTLNNTSGQIDLTVRNTEKIDARYIFVVGTYKVGKTFIINQLANLYGLKTQKSDEVDNTRGELLYELNKQTFMVDTEGIHQPLSTGSSKFIKSFILEHAAKAASLIIFVVDKFVESDWFCFEELVAVLRTQESPSTVIFCHNCKHISTDVKLAAYINQVSKFLKQYMSGKTDKDDVISYHQKIEVRHIFLGNKDTMRDRNNLYINMIKKQIDVLTKKTSLYDQTVLETTSSMIKSFYKVEGFTPKIVGDKIMLPEQKIVDDSPVVRYNPPTHFIQVKNDTVELHINIPFCSPSTVKIVLPEDNKVQVSCTQNMFEMDGVQKEEVEFFVYLNRRVLKRPKDVKKYNDEKVIDTDVSQITFVLELNE